MTAHSLATALLNGPQLSRAYADTSDAAWLQFLDDHKTILKRESDIVTLTADMTELTKFSLPQFLRSDPAYDESIAFIVRSLNDIPNDWYFTYQEDGNPRTLYIPKISIIEELYQSYITTTQRH